MKTKIFAYLFQWELCDLCGPFLRCPRCGNNSCNGGSGTFNGQKCDICPITYDLQAAIWRRNDAPESKDFQIQKPKAPIGRIIREGSQKRCPECHSSMQIKMLKFWRKNKGCIQPECKNYETP